MKAAIIGVLGSLLGTYVGAWLNAHNTRQLAEMQAFEVAASKFRSDIINTLKGYYPIFTDGVWGDPLREKFTAVLNAATEFHFFVQDKEGFDMAIISYKNFCGPYHSFEISADHVDLQLQNAYRKRVDDLLSFSKPPKYKSCTDRFFGAAPAIRQRIGVIKKKFCS